MPVLCQHYATFETLHAPNRHPRLDPVAEPNKDDACWLRLLHIGRRVCMSEVPFTSSPCLHCDPKQPQANTLSCTAANDSHTGSQQAQSDPCRAALGDGQLKIQSLFFMLPAALLQANTVGHTPMLSRDKKHMPAHCSRIACNYQSCCVLGVHFFLGVTACEPLQSNI
jgi:hypothetical protein